MNEGELHTALYGGISLFLLLSVGIVFFVVKYSQKQREFYRKKQLLEQQFSKEIAKVQFEVSEITLQRISKELHDNVAQSLVVATYAIRMLDHQSMPELATIHEALQEGLLQLRSMSHSLSNHRLDSGLRSALMAELDRVSASLKIRTHLEEVLYDDIEKLIGREEWETDLILYRCFQEILSNIIKHADASELTVTLSGDDSRLLSLEVQDNGKGFDTSVASTGIGMKNIEARMKLFEGTVTLHSELGKGSRIKLSLV